MKMLTHVKSQFSDFFFLVKTGAPPWFIFRHFLIHIKHRLSTNRKCFIARQNEFRSEIKQLDFSNDWFTANLPTWFQAFDECQIEQKQSLRCLEIGSWQGLSAFFILTHFQNACLTCVDTWEGADEHKSDHEMLARVEGIFDHNTKRFGDRLRKYRGTSFSYMNISSKANEFDLIYVDGSHHTDDVVVDVFKCFEKLKVGGVMILDDYLWSYYKEPIDNPAGAINAFLRVRKKYLKVICSDYQLVIQKRSCPER